MHAVPLAVSIPNTNGAGTSAVASGGGYFNQFMYNGTSADNLLDNSLHDIVRQLQATGSKQKVVGTEGIQGDIRMIAGLADVPATYFEPSANYRIANAPMISGHTLAAAKEHLINGIRSETGAAFGDLVTGLTQAPFPIPPAAAVTQAVVPAKWTASIPYTHPGVGTPDPVTGVLPNGPRILGVKNADNLPGDWDRGIGVILDGALCNKSDEGASPSTEKDGAGTTLTSYMGTAEFGGRDVNWIADTETEGMFSPNRQIASAVMFGSLPTGVRRARPWQTLLFRPAKYYWPGGNGVSDAGVQHPGSAKYGPPDHLLLDLFWMPVVEPYPISEPFATGGKVNLNQQIVPFTKIKRDTALRAVLKSVKIAALNPFQLSAMTPAPTYIAKNKEIGESWEGVIHNPSGGGQGVVNRRTIDLDNTLKQITDRLDNNQPFVSASEICDIPLIPKDVPVVTDDTPSEIPMYPMKQHISAQFAPNTPLSQFDAKLALFWMGNGTPAAAPSSHKLTGDNLLERPYAAIYPRLTTRSNTYTVHVRVQTLKQNDAKKSYVVKYSESQPTGEFRGSYVVERYLDPNSAGIYKKDETDFSPANKVTGTIIPGAHVLGPYRFRIVSSRQFQPE